MLGREKCARCQDRTDDLGIMRPTRYRLRQPRPLCCQNRHVQKAIAAGLEPATVGSEVQRSSIEPRDQLLAEHIKAALAQLGERQTEDLKVPGSIPGGGSFSFFNGSVV